MERVGRTRHRLYTNVKIGSVDAGIIWDALAVQYPELETIELPEFQKGKQQIVIGVLTSSKRPTEALRFARYLAAQGKGLKVFSDMGYDVVEGDIWETRPRVTVYSGGVNRIAIEKTLANFQHREDVDLVVNYNGCGILCAQMKGIRDGNPGMFPDAYFACEISFLDQVNDLFVDAENYSETDMVIITQPGNPENIQSLKDLIREGLKVGVANPDESALGALTRTLLKSLQLYDAVSVNISTMTPTADLLVNQVKVHGLDAAIVYQANTSQVSHQIEVIKIDHPLAHAVQPYAVARSTEHGQTVKRLLAALRAAPEDFEAAGFRYVAETAGQ